MQKEIQDLVKISRQYGSDTRFVLSGGGNTSYKNEKYIWVKASGFSMAEISQEGFVQLYRERVKATGEKEYSTDVHLREKEVKEDLLASRVHPEGGLRPSVETSLHEVIAFPYIVHTHPTLVNGLMCSVQAGEMTRKMFGTEILFVPYSPGYRLFKTVAGLLEKYRKKGKGDPNLLFLQNHGIFVGAKSIQEVNSWYDYVMNTLRERIDEIIPSPLPEHKDTGLLLQGLEALASGHKQVVTHRHHTLHRYFYLSPERFSQISRPFIPDIIVYCGPAYLYSDKDNTGSIIKDIEDQWKSFYSTYRKTPRMILIKDFGLFAVAPRLESATAAMDVFDDFMKISKYSQAFGGPHPMPEDEIEFIDRWEVENYRRKISQTGG